MRVGLRKARWGNRASARMGHPGVSISLHGCARERRRRSVEQVEACRKFCAAREPACNDFLSLLPRLQLTPTGVNWFERPVYKVTNLGTQALSTVVVYNWSGLMLTPLYIGSRAPTNLATRPPLDHSPITLPSGTSLWVVGSSPPPVH